MSSFFDIVDLMDFGNVIAYLDPGTGSLVLQFLIAAFLSAGLVLKAYWHSVVSFFRPKSRSNEVDSLNIEQKTSEKVEEVGRKAA